MGPAAVCELQAQAPCKGMGAQGGGGSLVVATLSMPGQLSSTDPATRTPFVLAAQPPPTQPLGNTREALPSSHGCPLPPAAQRSTPGRPLCAAHSGGAPGAAGERRYRVGGRSARLALVELTHELQQASPLSSCNPAPQLLAYLCRMAGQAVAHAPALTCFDLDLAS